MVGITAYGAYVPLYRLGKESQGWNTPRERAVANFDEDSITMGLAAAISCLGGGLDRSSVDGLYFASTTPPFKEKQSAAMIATALDLSNEILTIDFSDSLRGGTTALGVAMDTIKAGRARQVMVVASDLRIAQPRSDMEPVLGDGAAAFCVGAEGVIAEIEDFYTVTKEITDFWRTSDDVFVRSWEDRFIMEKGYLDVTGKAVAAILKRKGLGLKDFSRVVLYAPEPRRHAELAKNLGVEAKAQLQDPMFNGLGNTGAAFAPMMLAAALEEAKPGERILVANYGNGADVLILRVTEEIARLKSRKSLSTYLKAKRILPDYQKYLRWRGLLDVAAATRRPPLAVPSVAALYREQAQDLKLYGVKCRHCGTPQFPEQRVCTVCRTKDEFDPYRFSDKGASLFTYSMDYLGPTPDPPLVVCIANFDGGGRMLCEMTDRDLEQIKVGMPLEMRLRHLHTVEGIRNYYWKCVPVRG